MTNPPSFVSRGWYRLRGQGWCASVECDRERPRDNSGLVGVTVMIDGEAFECIAVERHLLATPLRQGETIGLLVREAAPLKQPTTAPASYDPR